MTLLRVLPLLVALLDPVDDGGVFGSGSDGLGDLLQLVVGATELFGGVPQLGLVLLGELAHEVRTLARGREVGAAETHAPAGAAAIDAGVLEEVDAPVGGRELFAHVGRGVDVDHAVASTGGPEHGEVAAVVLDELGVDSGAAAPEGTDELADEAVALELTHAGDDRQPGMQVERERVGSRLDHESLISHVTSSADPCRALSNVFDRALIRWADSGAPAILDRPSGAPAQELYSALLAQSAEHSHGKAGVVGSIPTEGSPSPRRGDLAA